MAPAWALGPECLAPVSALLLSGVMISIDFSSSAKWKWCARALPKAVARIKRANTWETPAAAWLE